MLRRTISGDEGYMKKILLICLLTGPMLTAHAEGRSTNGSLLKSERAVSGSVSKAGSEPKLRSTIAVIFDQQTQSPLYTKNSDALTPIASITKLMTAMVVLD